MNRFDIISAWYLWLSDHHTGLGSIEYARLCKVGSYYTPGNSDQYFETLSEDAQDIYRSICDRTGNKCSCGEG